MQRDTFATVDYYAPLIAAGGSLVGASIGAGAALGSQVLQWKRERKDQRQRTRQQAVEEVLVQVESIDLALHRIATFAKEFTSLAGQLNRLLRISKAFDLNELYSELNRHVDSLNRAAAQIWMTADQETVLRTNAVVVASMELVTAHSAVRPVTWKNPERLLDGLELADETVVAAARKRLAEVRRDLVEHTRREFGLARVDLFGLPDDFELRDHVASEPPDAS